MALTGIQFRPQTEAIAQGPDDVLKRVNEMANHWAADRRIVSLAREITRPARSQLERAYLIWRWVRMNIRGTNDPLVYEDGTFRRKEVIRNPLQIIAQGSGDCDEHTTLALTLLRAVGLKAVPVLAGVNGQVRHIYSIVILPNRRKVIVDTTAPYFNWSKYAPIQPLTEGLQTEDVEGLFDWIKGIGSKIGRGLKTVSKWAGKISRGSQKVSDVSASLADVFSSLNEVQTQMEQFRQAQKIQTAGTILNAVLNMITLTRL